MMIRLKRVIESARERLREAYHQQSEIVSVKPLIFHSQPELKSFEIKGVIHDTCTRNKIGHGGKRSKKDDKLIPHINFKKEWEQYLTPPFFVHLIETDQKGIVVKSQVDNKGIIIQSLGGDKE